MKRRQDEFDDLLTRQLRTEPQTLSEESRQHIWNAIARGCESATERSETRLRSETENMSWFVTGIVLATVLVSALIWRNGPPFSTAFKDSNIGHSLTKPTQQGTETLQITIPEAFDVASVKLLSPSSEAVQLASMGEASQLKTTGCPGGSFPGPRLDPGRLTISSATVLTLVMVAYGLDCRLVDGGPTWARSGEYYEIQALLPAGTPRYTQTDLVKGNAPRLQGMLQSLLAERFHLVLKRELREMSVYALTVANPGKMKLSPDETLPLPSPFLGWQSASPGMPAMALPPAGRGQIMSIPGATFGHAVTMPDLVRELRRLSGRIVVDKTGRSDVFDVDLRFARNTGPSAAVPPPVPPQQAIPPLPEAPSQATPTLPGLSFQDALEEQLGLRLEATKMPLEVLVIESVERPSAN